ncbi:hypothetical protein J6590_069708 [Homalodisca vitripennis]|nr:hypothetical protein J6590_069708 [Homalodisca vitripennis]
MSNHGLESLINIPTRVGTYFDSIRQETIISRTCIDHVFARFSDKRIVSVDLCVAVLGVKGRPAAALDADTGPPRRIDYAALCDRLQSADWAPVGLRRDLWLGRLALLPSMYGLSFDGRSVSAQSRMMEQVARMPSV